MDRSTLLADLNPPQREAVEWGDGPLLIVAGAGSGKTRVITKRIAHLIACGVPAPSILAITFTNKAAEEMRTRVSVLVGEGRVWLSTFHAFCVRVLRAEGRAIGLDPAFSIYDRDDQVSLIKELCANIGVDTQNIRPRAVLAAISRLKNEGVLAAHPDTLDGSPFERIVGRVYAGYAAALRDARAVDFDDLLLLSSQLLRENQPILERYRARFRYVLVDEYQDTNLLQYRLAADIAAGSGNLCATGDPDQSIYGWRGARIRNILDFERDFPGAHIVRLAQNYRSTQHILAAASEVIGNNPGRLMGPLWSELGDGNKVRIVAADDEENEAASIVQRVVQLQQQGLRLTDMAVFYRTNALSRGLERALRLSNVPYEIVGTVEFFERKEVKDLLAYLRILVNPADTVAFLRVVNVPSRGIGRATVEKLRAWAVPLGLTPREAARRAAEVPGLGSRASKALAAFSVQLDRLEQTLSGEVESVLDAILADTEYFEYLRDYGGPEALERIENVEELKGAVAAYARSAAEPSVAGFLEETALVSDVDNYDSSAERLTLMTLHSAKGLEFPAVFMVGMEEGLLPHMRAMDSDVDVQEERRLAYVGMTRAQRHLQLSFAARRPVMGAWMPTTPSRFLEELPADHVEWPAERVERRTWVRPERRVEDVAETFETGLDEEPPRPGEQVRHAHFGQGVVLKIIGSGHKARVTVRFERFGEKQLVAGYARLERVF